MTTNSKHWARRAGMGALLALATVASTTASAQTMRFSTEPSLVGLMHWWAEEKGLFKQNNLDYTLTVVNAAAPAIQAIGGGSNDAVSATEPPIVINLTKGIDAVIVGTVAIGQGIFKLVAPRSVTSLDQLKGKKVTWMAGTGGEYAWVKYLESKNVPVSAFEFVNLEPSEGVPTLINGGVVALWGWEPWPRRAVSLKPGDFHVLATSSTDTYEGYMITVVGRQFAEKNPESVKRYLKSLGEAATQINANQEEAAALYARRLRIGVPDAKVAMNDYRLGVHLDGSVSKSLTDVTAYLHGKGRVDKQPDWRTFINASYLKAVDPARVKDF